MNAKVKTLPDNIVRLQIESAAEIVESLERLVGCYESHLCVYKRKRFLFNYFKARRSLTSLRKLNRLLRIGRKVTELYTEANKTRETSELCRQTLNYLVELALCKEDIIVAFSYDLQKSTFSTKHGIDQWVHIKNNMIVPELKVIGSKE